MYIIYIYICMHTYIYVGTVRGSVAAPHLEAQKKMCPKVKKNVSCKIWSFENEVVFGKPTPNHLR